MIWLHVYVGSSNYTREVKCVSDLNEQRVTI